MKYLHAIHILFNNALLGKNNDGSVRQDKWSCKQNNKLKENMKKIKL